jgi:hypothetical protein
MQIDWRCQRLSAARAGTAAASLDRIEGGGLTGLLPNANSSRWIPWHRREPKFWGHECARRLVAFWGPWLF